jgi:hypothetical protein
VLGWLQNPLPAVEAEHLHIGKVPVVTTKNRVATATAMGRVKKIKGGAAERPQEITESGRDFTHSLAPDILRGERALPQ